MKERQTGNRPDYLKQTKREQTKPKKSTSFEKERRCQARIRSRRGIKS
jgi:hypothetical protein